MTEDPTITPASPALSPGSAASGPCGFNRLFPAAAVLLMAALYAAALWWSPLNQDEGWYLYASRLVTEGNRPYADFAFTQGPVLPRVYALFFPLVERWGVAGGRAVTAFFGLLSVGLSALLARRLSGRSGTGGQTAALLAVSLCGWNITYVMFTTVVKTYGLCAALLTGGCLLLVSANHARRPALHALAAGLLLALAAGTRSSAAMAVPAAFIGLWRDRSAQAHRNARIFLAAVLIVSMGIWIPSARAAPEGLRFALVSFHAGRTFGGFLAGLAYRFGFLSRVVRAYLPALLLAAWPLLPGHRKPGPGVRAHGKGAGRLWGVLGLTSLLHLAAPFPYDDYQVFLFPVFAALAAAGMTRWAEGRPRAHTAPAWAGITLLVILHTLGSPVLQDWAVSGQDRVWWRFRSRSNLADLRHVALRLRTEFPDADTILTQDTYLAVETGWTVPPGLELGPFSYYPDFTDDEAARLRVLNRAGLDRLLAESPAPVAAFSGYGLSISSPALSELPRAEQDRLQAALRRRYEHLRTVPWFGQAGTPLEIYRLRPARGPDPERAP